MYTHLWQHEAWVALQFEVSNACCGLLQCSHVLGRIVSVIRAAGIEGGPLRCTLPLGLTPQLCTGGSGRCAGAACLAGITT